MANFDIRYNIQYIDGSRVGLTEYGPTYTVTDSGDSDIFLVGDQLIGLFGGFTIQLGVMLGTTSVGGHTYIIAFAEDQDGTQRHYVLGPGGPDAPSFPQNFNDLIVDGSPFTVCFLAGTRIATPGGGTPVESLAIGDRVLTADGSTAPVRWVGVQTIVSVFADRLRCFPIRITAGALGPDMPVRDLLVSPDHALFLDGVLVQAGALANGTTIVRETAMPERFTYFHVELEDHALILAEGVPAETFLDTVTRRRFDNFAEYAALYGDGGAAIGEMAAPRVKSARQLPQALRGRFAAANAA